MERVWELVDAGTVGAVHRKRRCQARSNGHAEAMGILHAVTVVVLFVAAVRLDSPRACTSRTASHAPVNARVPILLHTLITLIFLLSGGVTDCGRSMGRKSSFG